MEPKYTRKGKPIYNYHVRPDGPSRALKAQCWCGNRFASDMVIEDSALKCGRPCCKRKIADSEKVIIVQLFTDGKNREWRKVEELAD